MAIPAWIGRAALAVVSADAVILTSLVNEKVISAQLGTEIGAIIAALAVGWQGHKQVVAVQNRQAAQ